MNFIIIVFFLVFSSIHFLIMPTPGTKSPNNIFDFTLIVGKVRFHEIPMTFLKKVLLISNETIFCYNYIRYNYSLTYFALHTYVEYWVNSAVVYY